jgi:carbonic anhydrase
MSLLDDVLAANSAVADGSDVPVPAIAAGRRVVVVTCSEIRAPGGRDLASFLGFATDDAFVVATAGARVRSPDGDAAASVVAGLALGDGGEVFVVAHEGCEFLEADPDSAAAISGASTSALLAAAQTLCGEDFISARKLAISSAETLRRSPFLAKCPVHALVFADGRRRVTSEQSGYGASAAASPATASGGLGAAPSPILAAPGPSGFGAPGPVASFGAGPSSLMAAPPPDLGAGAAASFLAPPAFVSPPPPAGAPAQPAFVMPPAPPPTPPVPSPPALEPLSFKDVPPPPPPRAPARPAPAPPPVPPRAPESDDPFKRAAETLERLRRERRK